MDNAEESPSLQDERLRNDYDGPTVLVPPGEGLFRILQQPADKQRKSYKNENRYLLPNPMVICPIQTIPPFVNGIVAVKLIYENQHVPDPPIQQNLLHGNLIRELDVNEKRACFVLKCLGTSDGQRFKLNFKVLYTKVGDQDNILYEEQLDSQPFVVTSNKKKQPINKPIIQDLKPAFGSNDTETEVWIKGSQFTDKAGMTVKFGGYEARVIDAEDNLITCLAPSRLDLQHETKVSVEVSNYHPNEGVIAGDKNLEFVYLNERG
ncbi:hypothetical protein PROFUN_04713 [Planoprotostelium fungivorum]|uniref:IPT/TIG domain-containing protein n=1 Tax=Planoprotostelium fungivorum TaxID=1890364 RepID=A0A2P6NFW5_9EUKA|nr:hypothetical protein PROFUN_04713 [Planoprotostelium fungivorum]